MEMIADILLVAGTLGAGFYCIVLARRLNKFTDLEKGVGGAIAVLSAQVDDMTKTLVQAQRTAAGSGVKLEQTTQKAEDVAKRLELLIASMHDIPEETVAPASAPEPSEPPQPDVYQTQEAERLQDPETPEPDSMFFSHRTRMEAAE